MSKFDILPALSPEEYEALKLDITRNGQRFPIIRDQNNITIDGHQRERILWEIPIPTDHWKVERRVFKDDAERLAFVISANLHRRHLTLDDRKALARRLYTEHDMNETDIARALGVSQPTIFRDLDGLFIVNKPPRPKGGRPKGSGKAAAAKPERQHKYDKATEDKAASLILDEAKTTAQVKAELGVSEQVVIRSVERERGRREARQEEPMVRREDLSLSYRKRFDAAIRQERKRLALEYRDRLWAEIKQHTDAVIIPDYQRQLDEAAALVRTRKGYMTLADWENIRRCVHPDNSASEAKRNRAFEVWNNPTLKLVLVPEAENPAASRHPQPPPLPSTYAEWMQRKAEVAAARKAARQPKATAESNKEKSL